MIQDIDLGYSIFAHYMRIKNAGHLFLSAYSVYTDKQLSACTVYGDKKLSAYTLYADKANHRNRETL